MNNIPLQDESTPTMVKLPLPILAMNDDFHQDSRLWFFTADRMLTPEEQEGVKSALNRFTAGWTAHHQQLKAAGELFQGRIIVLLVDESKTGASGCSIDKATHLVEQLGTSLKIDFFNRFLFTWADENGNIRTEDKTNCEKLLKAGTITKESYFFDTLASTKAQLFNQGWMPYSKSWVRRII